MPLLRSRLCRMPATNWFLTSVADALRNWSRPESLEALAASEYQVLVGSSGFSVKECFASNILHSLRKSCQMLRNRCTLPIPVL